jgi:hypothetical protein
MFSLVSDALSVLSKSEKENENFLLNHHPQPSSSIIILNHHPQPSSSTIIWVIQVEHFTSVPLGKIVKQS